MCDLALPVHDRCDESQLGANELRWWKFPRMSSLGRPGCQRRRLYSTSPDSIWLSWSRHHTPQAATDNTFCGRAKRAASGADKALYI